ncbi:MAG TPA: RNA polymerase sigma factor region1.1 domain-containing protein [Lachnospiraceae bacterium]|nr:RNA polymerase sigma factor region1.1 domain-containing protein [Lachnospiraceae bacterium]
MERELLFADKLQEIRKIAKKQGNLVTKEQVEESFVDFSLDQDQLSMVYDYLQKHHIGVGEPVDTEEYLSEEERNFLQTYLDEIAAIEPVSNGEKEAITLSAMSGDVSAQQRLTTLYLSQTVDIAKLYVGQGVILEDLIGEGNVAVAIGVKMLGALKNAREAEGMLGKMIMDAMEEYISQNTEDSKKDKHITDQINKVAIAAGKLAEEYGRKVTPEELVAESNLSLKVIQDAIRISGGKIEDLEN